MIWFWKTGYTLRKAAKEGSHNSRVSSWLFVHIVFSKLDSYPDSHISSPSSMRGPMLTRDPGNVGLSRQIDIRARTFSSGRLSLSNDIAVPFSG